VAPTSIPSPRGKQIKTDRIDAAQLVQFYANGLLTLVEVPEAEQEQDRDLLRTRKRLIKHQAELRSHLQALLRRHGLHYREQTGYKSHWTKLHYSWLHRTVETATGSLKISLDVLLRQLGTTDRTIAEYDQHIEALASSPRYEEAVKALVSIADRCLRRLHKEGTRLLQAGKHSNKVKVACAREMAGFIWESLNKVAA